MNLLGKGEAYFYLALQEIGRYKDSLAVVHVQEALVVSKTILLRMFLLRDKLYDL